MLVISSEGGRFPLGLIIVSAFWMVCFGIFVSGYSKDSLTCIVRPDNEFPAALTAIDDIKNNADSTQANSISIDVAIRFRSFFIFGMCLTAFQVVIGSFSWLVRQSVNMARFLFNLYHFSQIIFLLNWIAIFYFRT
jgi:hypothetical protein